MNYWSLKKRNDERKEDKPPYSRIFVVCSKQLREEDLRPHFERFGDIEDLYMPRDRNTGESKGVAYIKYRKTLSAAAAIQELHMKIICNEVKPVKVMVASNKNDTYNTNEERYKRLFIRVHIQATEAEIRRHFSAFGHLESVHIQRDKVTDENKGFAYIHYKTFYEAAKAFEECDRRYRPVFATPKDELKRSRNSLDYIENLYTGNTCACKEGFSSEHYNQIKDVTQNRKNINSLLMVQPENYNTVSVTCSPQVPQKHIERLFNVIPGMLECQYSIDTYNGFCKAIVTYEDEVAAAYAVKRLNNFEFPSGEIISVKPDTNPLSKAANNLTNIVNNFKNSIDSNNSDLVQLADVIAQASSLIKVATSGKIEQKLELQDKNYCSVSLPPPCPMVNSNSRVVQRCFVVCKPQPPPLSALRDVFCRFGDLIDVSTFPNKTFGFAKYASVKSAQEAIKTLNGAILCGVKLKVMEADEKPTKDDNQKCNEDGEQNECHTESIDRKRIKLNNEDR